MSKNKRCVHLEQNENKIGGEAGVSMLYIDFVEICASRKYQKRITTNTVVLSG